MKRMHIQAALTAALPFLSCAHQTAFKATSPGRPVKPGTLAVIPGDNSPSEMIIIEYLDLSPDGSDTISPPIPIFDLKPPGTATCSPGSLSGRP